MNEKVEKIVLKGNGLTSGIVEGEALVTKQPINLLATYRGFIYGQPSSLMGDVKHELYGQDIHDKILVFPYGIGSLSCGVILFEAIKQRVAPKAIINLETEAAVLAGAIFSEVFYDVKMPIVDKLERNPFEVIETGDYVRVDADKGIVEVIKKKQLKA